MYAQACIARKETICSCGEVILPGDRLMRVSSKAMHPKCALALVKKESIEIAQVLVYVEKIITTDAEAEARAHAEIIELAHDLALEDNNKLNLLRSVGGR